jgi:UvrD-like helicase C-terminal domain/Nuclease-related domain
MPRMLPTHPDGDAPDSERKVFAAFERHLPRNWTVFHSRRIVLPRQGANSVVEHELDFLVIDPARGLLGLEVKGGVEIGRDTVLYPSAPEPGQVHFATLQGFKGLEADAVVLCESQKGNPNSSEQHLYIAASRARHVLAVAEYTSAER